MIQVDLAAEIASTQPPAGSVACWWLGQAGFVLRGDGLTVYLDPFLSDFPGRLIAAPFSPQDAPPADLVLVTHEHLDHLDKEAVAGIAGSSPSARFVVPEPVVGQLTKLGIEQGRITGAQPGQEVDLDGARVYPVPAAHGLTSPPATYGFSLEESGGLYRFLGYVLELSGVRVYHAGDTVVYEGMAETLRGLRVDVGLLPINGRSFFREQQDIVGNMDEREAADLAAAAGIPFLVPCHYEMFSGNLGRPGVLVEYVRQQHPEITVLVPAHFRRFTYTRGDAR